MAQKVLPDMAQRGLGALFERLGRQDEFSQEEAKELLAGCQIGFLLLQKLRDMIEKFLDDGVEAEAFRVLLQEAQEVFDLGTKAFGAVRAKIQSSPLPKEEKKASLSAIDLLISQAKETLEKLILIRNWLDTPIPSRRPTSFPTIKGDRDAPGFINMDQLKARLFSSQNP